MAHHHQNRDYQQIVRFQPGTISRYGGGTYIQPPSDPRYNPCYQCEQSRVQTLALRAPVYSGAQLQNTTVSRTCVTCGERFHRAHGESRTACSRCYGAYNTVTRHGVGPSNGHGHGHRTVAGFSQTAVTSVARSVFTQPRGPNVTAREVRFNDGTFTVREEYRRF